VPTNDLRANHLVESGLLAVLDQRLIHSLYQPVVALDDGGIVGFEALARGPDGSPWASPASLFAGAAAAGRLPELDWMCRAAAIHGAAAASLDAQVALFINVEPASNRIPVPDDFAEAVATARAGRWPIIAEITERAIAGDPDGLLTTVDGLRRRNRHVALDDVGADPASQAIMPLLRPDVIKLDRAIIADPHTDHAKAVIAAVRAEAGRDGGAAIILAEGIETPGHLAAARSIGATLGQGFLLGRPAPLPHAVTPHIIQWPRRSSLPTSAPTPFDTVTVRVPCVTLGKEAIYQLSRAIEDRAAALPEPGILLANFQHRDRFTPEIARRYAALATQSTLVGIFAQDMPADPAPQVAGYPLRPDDPVAAEWSVILVTSTRAEGMFARTTGERDSYRVAVCDNRELVLAAARSLIQRMQVRHLKLRDTPADARSAGDPAQ
jgi:EAL domain-containing protein (putative c-di-GMP-specific phosphodiesterase class I)/DICT domain-containing protein